MHQEQEQAPADQVVVLLAQAPVEQVQLALVLAVVAQALVQALVLAQEQVAQAQVPDLVLAAELQLVEQPAVALDLAQQRLRDNKQPNS